MARPRRSEGVRERLLEEGVASLVRHGYHGTGLQEVLERAAVPKGSFYHYFRSKEDFAAEAIRRYASCLADELSAAVEGASDPLVGLRRFFRAQVTELASAGYVGGCLVANLGAELEENDACRDVLRSSLLAYRDGLRAALDACRERGLLRDDLPARDMADLLVAAWEGAVIRSKIERSPRPMRQCLAQLLDGYFRP